MLLLKNKCFMVDIMFKTLASISILVFLTSCATIVNDANVPVTLSFSDGSSGTCDL